MRTSAVLWIVGLLAIIGCVWAIAHVAGRRGRSAMLWGTLACGAFAVELALSGLAVRWLSHSNAAFTTGGVTMAVLSIVAGPVLIATTALATIWLLGRLTHGSIWSRRRAMFAYVRLDTWDDGRVCVVRSHADRLEIEPEPGGETKHGLSLPLADIRSATLDGEYLELTWSDGSAGERRLSLTPWGDDFTDRESKREQIASMRRSIDIARRPTARDETMAP